MTKKKTISKKAFTIIEFTLATTFLSVLLMGITTITMRILEIYQKGLALRDISSTGRDILHDVSKSIGDSPIVDNINPTASNHHNISDSDIRQAYRAYFNEIMVMKNGRKVQAGGVFCTGEYSYIWNTAPSIEAVRADSDRKQNMLLINNQYYKFARIPDNDRSVGKTTATLGGAGYQLANRNFTANAEDVVSLISDNDSDLALYDFVVLPATQNNKTGQIFYSGSFILATMRGGVNVMTNGDFCTGTETMYGTDVEATSFEFNYCAVNKFNFAVRATGQTTNTNQYGER